MQAHLKEAQLTFTHVCKPQQINRKNVRKVLHLSYLGRRLSAASSHREKVLSAPFHFEYEILFQAKAPNDNHS